MDRGGSSALHPVKTWQNRKPTIMRDTTTDLRWTNFQLSAQAPGFYCSSPVTVWKAQALTAFELWHLVKENAICIRHNPVCLLCVCYWAWSCLSRCERVCRCSKKERRESPWDLLALVWHAFRQTHFIMGLFTWLTGLLYQLHTTFSNTPSD